MLYVLKDGAWELFGGLIQNAKGTSFLFLMVGVIAIVIALFAAAIIIAGRASKNGQTGNNDEK